MANILLSARSLKPGSSEVKLIDGDANLGYSLIEAAPPDWGNAVWAGIPSGNRGTMGARLAGAEPQNRPLLIPLQVTGTSHDDLEAKIATLWSLDDEFRRFGGVLTWRPRGSSFKQYFDVLDCSARVTGFGRLYHLNAIAMVELAPVCAPYLRYDPMDIFDGFDTDTSLDYTKDDNTAGLTISGGTLNPTTTGTARWRHTGRGYQYGDVEATLKLTTGTTVASYEADVFINAVPTGLDTMIFAQLLGGNLRIIRTLFGVVTVEATTAFAVSTSTTYWLRIRREGRNLTALVYTAEPTPLATPAASTIATLTAFNNLWYSQGHAGIRPTVVHIAERYDDFRVEPFTYVSPVSLA